ATGAKGHERGFGGSCFGFSRHAQDDEATGGRSVFYLAGTVLHVDVFWLDDLLPHLRRDERTRPSLCGRTSVGWLGIRDLFDHLLPGCFSPSTVSASHQPKGRSRHFTLVWCARPSLGLFYS